MPLDCNPSETLSAKDVQLSEQWSDEPTISLIHSEVLFNELFLRKKSIAISLGSPVSSGNLTMVSIRISLVAVWVNNCVLAKEASNSSSAYKSPVLETCSGLDCNNSASNLRMKYGNTLAMLVAEKTNLDRRLDELTNQILINSTIAQEIAPRENVMQPECTRTNCLRGASLEPGASMPNTKPLMPRAPLLSQHALTELVVRSRFLLFKGNGTSVQSLSIPNPEFSFSQTCGTFANRIGFDALFRSSNNTFYVRAQTISTGSYQALLRIPLDPNVDMSRLDNTSRVSVISAPRDIPGNPWPIDTIHPPWILYQYATHTINTKIRPLRGQALPEDLENLNELLHAVTDGNTSRTVSLSFLSRTFQSTVTPCMC